MASVYDLKPRFQDLLRPLVGALRRLGVTPNGVTLFAMAGSVAAGLLLLRAETNPRWLLMIPAWLFARMALNAIDGMMAREHQLTSRLGAVLNETGDVLSDVALYLPLAFLFGHDPWPAFAFVLGAVFTEFCGVLGPMLGSERQYQGPMGKSDRAFWVGLLTLATAFRPDLETHWHWFFWVAAALTIPTCFARLRVALRTEA